MANIFCMNSLELPLSTGEGTPPKKLHRAFIIVFLFFPLFQSNLLEVFFVTLYMHIFYLFFLEHKYKSDFLPPQIKEENEASRCRPRHSGPRLVCSMLVNSDILTANYGVRQSRFTKPTSEPLR